MQLSAAEQTFLDASLAERDREAADLVERENRAIEAERRQRRRGRQLVGVGLVAVLVAALAAFGTVQWRAAANAKRDVEDLLRVDDLVNASRATLGDDPELALLLAMQSVRETVDLGFATTESVDAVHFALQELGVQYDVDPATPVAVRPGPYGRPVGVYALTPNELMAAAESATRRTLTDAECAAVLAHSCPAPVDVPENLRLRDGLDSYGASAPGPRALAGTRITLSASGWTDHQGLIRELREFIDRTGITVEFTPDEARTLLDSPTDEPGRRPDAFIGATLPAWVEAGAMDIRGFVDPETLRSDFGDYLLGAATLLSEDRGARPADGRGLGAPHRRQPQRPRVLPGGRVPRSGIRDPDDVGRTRRAVSSDRC